MPIYVCPRCRHSTTIKNHIKKHFNRKRPCKCLHTDISLEECRLMLSAISLSTKPSTKIQKKCQYCSKVFTREDNRRRHLINCKKNHQHQNFLI